MFLNRLISVLTLSTAVLLGCDQQGSSSSGSPASAKVNSAAIKNVDDDYVVLTNRARAYVTEWHREDPLCDEIESPNLDSIQKGTIAFIATGGGKVEPAIPAIVARISGTCIFKSARKREPITKFWMMMAHDKAFGMFICIKVGGEDLIKRFIDRDCKFVPNLGEPGLIQVVVPTPIVAPEPAPVTSAPQLDVPVPAQIARVASSEPSTVRASDPVSAVLASNAVTWAPSFDCLKALTGAERLICSNKELSEADVRLSQTYRMAESKVGDKQSLQNAQVEWRKNERDACSDMKCMLSAYQSRIAQLQ